MSEIKFIEHDGKKSGSGGRGENGGAICLFQIRAGGRGAICLFQIRAKIIICVACVFHSFMGVGNPML